MYRWLRQAHKWVGVVACLFLMVISASGFFLAIKGNVGWMRPETQEGGAVGSLSEVVGVGPALESAVGVGLAELQGAEDVDRFEYHVGKNVYKVLSARGYHEVQVCGATGKVLSVGRRNDQLTEDIHDLSFFQELAKEWGLPLVALGLFGLSCSGVVMFFTPVVRRWKFRRGGGRME